MAGTEPSSPRLRILLNDYNRTISSTNDLRLAAIEIPILDVRADAKRDRVHVDIVRSRYAQFLQENFCWLHRYSTKLPCSSIIPSMRHASKKLSMSLSDSLCLFRAASVISPVC